ncbi:MAG TPA: hypothetical protein VHW04_13870 [Solirubrobacteraceae bacterium]|nr:hypothetical protein [Solirubrobacteraceae bacterium]
MSEAETLDEHAGGDEGLHRLEEIFYAKALADPVLKPLFTELLPTDERFVKAVREHVEFGAHVAQQNSRAQTDAELHPIRDVPIWSW